jgi:hypothetical protein
MSNKTEEQNNNLEPILLIEYEDISKEYLININGILYHIESIYQWIITQSHVIDPFRQIVSEEDVEKIKQFYNIYLITNASIETILEKIINDEIDFNHLPEKHKNNKILFLEAVKTCTTNIIFFPIHFNDDLEFISEVLKINGILF